MAYIINETVTGNATLYDVNGNPFDVDLTKQKNFEFYNVTEIDGRFNMNIFKVLGKTCKTGNDVVVLGELLQDVNQMNELIIPNISAKAEKIEISRKHLNTVLNNAVDSNLLHKMDSGYYLVNPYVLMMPKASKSGYKIQELIQVRWKEETGLITELEYEQLIALTDYLGLSEGLRPTEFNISVAGYYARDKKISPRQKTKLLKQI